MLEDGRHYLLFEYFVERIYLEVLPSDGEVIGDRIELNAVDGLFKLKLLYNIIGPFIDNVEPAFFAS